ncbi:hypothetical protein J2I47_11655 [Fibrella sp. HMF5335]|uniref:histidine kinase n=1 Tax=Fibrella rubiginis TaxID=2817060 RepID=A0A939GDY3_9BACT|nr:7TM diverse intracellular signaling domain-containing protein [Fibrella rubiginis]MBO0937204.1 hypothetical protein [Fibrella rubiginis]
MRQLYFILLVCLFTAPASGDTIRIMNPATANNLFGMSSLLEVPAGKVSIDQLLEQPAAYRFVPAENNLIKPYDRRYGYWLRLTIENQTPESLYMHFVYTGTERILVYEVADNQVLTVHRLGMLQPERVFPFLKSNQVCPLAVGQGQMHLVYVYVEGIYTTAWPIYCRSTANLFEALHRSDLFYGLYYGFILMIVVYSLLLFVRLRETDTFRYAVWVFIVGLQMALFRGHTGEFLWPANPAIERYATVLAGITGLTHVLFTLAFLRLRHQAPLFYNIGLGILGLYAVGILINILTLSVFARSGVQVDFVPIVALVEGIFSVWAGVVTYRRGFRPALFYVIGNLVFFLSIFVFLLYAFGKLPHSFWTYNSMHIGSGIEIILFTLALTYKVNLLKQQQEEAVREQLRLAEKNRQLVEDQNAMLEEKVALRTVELNEQKEGLQTTLAQLRTTQDQLVQREKMASLGELMAGIAHEIQNPLNFVNNFAEVSVDMLAELKDELNAGHKQDVLDIADALTPNLQKITFHGKRADAIVRGMLQHAQSSNGHREPTDINALAGEYLRLAYLGLRAKNEDVAITLSTSFDPNVGLVDLMPQEMARVMLNLYNNAFYAVLEKKKKAPAGYQPQLWVTTQLKNGRVAFTVKDNGTGIPTELLNKIYQPFFTTKPSGSGTGLGLSLSYDIITKGHGGTLSVNTEQGECTEFEVAIPV